MSTLAEYAGSVMGLLQAMATTGRGSAPLAAEDAFAMCTGMILECKDKGGLVMVIGNGGSSAIALHLQNDLCASVGVRCLGLTDIPLLTALSNDYGYKYAYQQQVTLWAGARDVLVAISSSGCSENILNAVAEARQHGAGVITLTGFSENNPLRAMGDCNFHIPSHSYGEVEVAHSLLSHYISDSARAAVMSGEAAQGVASSPAAPRRGDAGQTHDKEH